MVLFNIKNAIIVLTLPLVFGCTSSKIKEKTTVLPVDNKTDYSEQRYQHETQRSKESNYVGCPWVNANPSLFLNK